MEASTKPAATPVPRELFAGLDTGAERSLVVERLGEPHGAMSNLGAEGDEELLTYLLAGGGQGSVRLKQGKIQSVRVPGR